MRVAFDTTMLLGAFHLLPKSPDHPKTTVIDRAHPPSRACDLNRLSGMGMARARRTRLGPRATGLGEELFLQPIGELHQQLDVVLLALGTEARATQRVCDDGSTPRHAPTDLVIAVRERPRH